METEERERAEQRLADVEQRLAVLEDVARRGLARVRKFAPVIVDRLLAALDGKP